VSPLSLSFPSPLLTHPAHPTNQPIHRPLFFILLLSLRILRTNESKGIVHNMDRDELKKQVASIGKDLVDRASIILNVEFAQKVCTFMHIHPSHSPVCLYPFHTHTHHLLTFSWMFPRLCSFVLRFCCWFLGFGIEDFGSYSICDG
jgi:hypothetical protein